MLSHCLIYNIPLLYYHLDLQEEPMSFKGEILDLHLGKAKGDVKTYPGNL